MLTIADDSEEYVLSETPGAHSEHEHGHPEDPEHAEHQHPHTHLHGPEHHHQAILT